MQSNIEGGIFTETVPDFIEEVPTLQPLNCLNFGMKILKLSWYFNDILVI